MFNLLLFWLKCHQHVILSPRNILASSCLLQGSATWLNDQTSMKLRKAFLNVKWLHKKWSKTTQFQTNSWATSFWMGVYHSSWLAGDYWSQCSPCTCGCCPGELSSPCPTQRQVEPAKGLLSSKKNCFLKGIEVSTPLKYSFSFKKDFWKLFIQFPSRN